MFSLKKKFNVKGTATIIDPENSDYKAHKKIFQFQINGKLIIQNIIRIKVKQVKKIIAPSNFLPQH